MKKIKLIVAALIVTLLLPVCAFAGKIVLPEGTEVKLKFDPSIKINSGKLQKGMEVPVYLAEDVEIGGKAIIEKDAKGKAEVVEIVESSKPGNPGYIKLSFSELDTKGEYKTANGEMIKLAGVIEDKGKGRKVLSLMFILGLFIKGSDGEIDASQVCIATVKETVILQTK
ncbi:hypothetical protein J7M07_08310 [bacterium]|nr:hypothetical protein [bacterium]